MIPIVFVNFSDIDQPNIVVNRDKFSLINPKVLKLLVIFFFNYIWAWNPLPVNTPFVKFLFTPPNSGNFKHTFTKWYMMEIETWSQVMGIGR